MKMSLRKHQRGVTAVEFGLGAMVLILSTLIIFESSYQVYVTNLVDYSLRETIRNTKIKLHDSDVPSDIHKFYQDQFDALINQSGQLWSFLVAPDKFSITGVYYDDYAAFVTGSSSISFGGESSEVESFDYSLAELTVSYDFSPMTHLFTSSDMTISRTMVLNLEHEEWPDENE